MSIATAILGRISDYDNSVLLLHLEGKEPSEEQYLSVLNDAKAFIAQRENLAKKYRTFRENEMNGYLEEDAEQPCSDEIAMIIDWLDGQSFSV